MSQELERVYTINLGKVLLTPDNQRAKRAVNMVKEFARHHMKTQEIKIEEDLNHLIWKRGIKHPPRKVRVKMTKTDEGFVLVTPYDEEIEAAVSTEEIKKSPDVALEKEGKEIEKPAETMEEKQKEIETTPEKPKETKPEKPKETKPEKPKETKPEKPKETKPEKPKETKPKKPKETKPKKSKESQKSKDKKSAKSKK